MTTPLLRKFVGLLFLFLSNFAAHAGNLTDSTKWIHRKVNLSHDSIETQFQENFNSKTDSSSSVLIANESLEQFYEDGLIIHTTPNDDSIRAIIDKATAVFAKIKQTQNFITNLNNTAGFELPIGISKSIGGLNYDIGIQAIRLKPTYAEIDVYMQFEIPQNGKVLTFMASGIKFSKAGGIIGDAKLSLVGDYAINFNGDKGQLVLKGGKGGSGSTFVRMDCDGFREMGLDAEVRFSRDLLLPEDVNGVVQAGNVVASFQSTISNWNDLLVQISLPHFQVAGLTGFGFSINDAVFDFSDTQNAPSVVFPKGYSVDTDPSLVNLWRGIYVRQFSVRLPSHFKDKQNASTSLTATDLLIDQQGVSGMFLGRNLIQLNNGDMNGWAFSVDSLAVSLMANQIQQAGFKGSIVVPVSDQQNALKYAASFSANNQYLFDIMSTKDIQFKIFQTSKVEIYKGSTLEIKLDNGRFLPKAILSGEMDITAKLSSGGQGVNIADIKFENLQIQSVQPYIQVGNFSFGSEAAKQAMAGYPIGITDVSMKNITSDQVGLNFDLKLNLVGESAGAFAADAGLIIVGQLNNTDGSQTWAFKEVQVRKIDIDIDSGPAFKFNGSLIFYREDPVYGDGFNGAIKATFLSKVTINASAIFGNLNGERYWYVDAMAKFTPGIPFFPGVGFYGFGGGAYYRMKMDQNSSSPLGKTASGTYYVPALENGLGLKAIVYLGSMPSEKAFTADVTFEISFFKDGGIHTISMTGNAFIATPAGLESSIDKLKSTVGNMTANLPKLDQALNSRVGQAVSRITDTEIANTKLIQGDIGDTAGDKGGISAHIYIGYDFENSTLHGNFDAKINVAAGVLQGGGDAVLHFAPEEWYVYVGTPDQRFTLSIGIGSIRATATSYFMVGTTIPGSPPPPPEVSQILGGVDLDYMKDLNAIGNGAGFAFGAALSIKTGDITFMMFYASLSAGAGFDIMIKDYGDTYCEGSSKRIGINGWYANGQSYAYFEGKIGIRVKVFGIKKNVEILSLGAATVMQAKLPNPVWMRGIVGGYFSVLGGVVKGQCSFQVTLGTDCKLIQKSDDSALDNLAVIAQLTPGVGETEVNVFNNPQAVFNLAIDKEFDLADGNTHQQYKIKLDYFNLTADGKQIQGNLQWNDDHTVAAISSFDVLPPKKEIKSSVQVSFQKLVNGSWQNVLENGQPIVEKQEVTFTTGDAPDYIPLSNVDYSYPIVGQLNFYKDESKVGYIKLKKGQPNLFDLGSDWVQVGRFVTSDGAIEEFNFTYNSGSINFKMPSNLRLAQIYGFKLVNVPASKSGAIDRNVSQVANQVSVDGQSTNTEIKTQQVQGSINQLQEKEIFNASFRSSSYPTVKEKLSNLNFSIAWTWALQPGVHEMGVNITGNEVFEAAEFVSSAYDQDRQISFEADLSSNLWYYNKVYPLIYMNYPLNDRMRISQRSISPLGIPPFKAIYLRQNPSDLSLTDDIVGVGYYSYPPINTSLIYNLSPEMYRDYVELQSYAANLSVSTKDAAINQLLFSQFPPLQGGDYKIKVKHQLPGTGTFTSQNEIIIHYPLK